MVILWARYIEKSPWAGLGFTKKGAGKDFLLGWGIGAAMLTTCTLIMWGLGAIEFTSIQFSTKLVGEFIILILAWSIQGTTEEILTRGWMFSSLSARHNIPIGIIVSSLFFTFLHLGNNAISLIPILDLTLFAVLTCLIMLKTGNIWVIGGLHAAWNCFQGNVFAFPVSGTDAGRLCSNRYHWSRVAIWWKVWCRRLRHQLACPRNNDFLVGLRSLFQAQNKLPIIIKDC